MDDSSRRLLTLGQAGPEEVDRPHFHRNGPFGVLDIGTT